MPGRRALITGATGFIGTNLIRRLLADRWQISVVIQKGLSAEPLGESAGRVELFHLDGTTDQLREIVSRAKPDVVFHLASLFLASHTSEQIVPLIESNVLFGTQLLEAMTANGIKRLVNVGTFWQHFESRELDPVNLYAATKQAFEAVLAYYVSARNIRALTLKLYDTYGIGDPRKKLIAILGEAAASKTELAMSPGEQLLSLVYVDDVVEAFVIAADRLFEGEGGGYESFAVRADELISVKDFVALYSRVSGKEISVKFGGRPYREREVMVPWLGTTLPGWKPKVSLEEGIRRVTTVGKNWI